MLQVMLVVFVKVNHLVNLKVAAHNEPWREKTGLQGDDPDQG